MFFSWNPRTYASIKYSSTSTHQRWRFSMPNNYDQWLVNCHTSLVVASNNDGQLLTMRWLDSSPKCGSNRWSIDEKWRLNERGGPRCKSIRHRSTLTPTAIYVDTYAGCRCSVPVVVSMTPCELLQWMISVRPGREVQYCNVWLQRATATAHNPTAAWTVIRTCTRPAIVQLSLFLLLYHIFHLLFVHCYEFVLTMPPVIVTIFQANEYDEVNHIDTKSLPGNGEASNDDNE